VASEVYWVGDEGMKLRGWSWLTCGFSGYCIMSSSRRKVIPDSIWKERVWSIVTQTVAR